MPLEHKTKEAASYILDHAHFFQSVLDMAAGVKSVEALEQAAHEAESYKLPEAQAKLDAVNAAAAKAEQDLAEAKSAIDAAKAEAESIIAGAREDAARLARQAEAEANEVRERGEADAADARRKGEDALDSANAERAAVDEQIAEKQAELERLTAAAESAEARENKARRYLESLAAGQ